MPNPARLWVVNYAGHNLSPALEYTSLDPDEAFRFLTEGSVNVFETDRLARMFDENMQEFQSHDFLVLTGSVVLNVLAALAALRRSPQVSILIWHAREHNYIARTIRATAGFSVIEKG